jgi:phage-related protein
MPDIAGSAAAGIAGLKATFTDIKDEIGLAVVPILGTLMTTFKKLADKFLPPVVDFIKKKLVPILETGASLFDQFIGVMTAGYGPVAAFVEILDDFLPEETIDAIWGFIDSVKEIIAQIQPYIDMAVAWIAENVQLKDVLIGLAVAIATVVVPAIVSLVASVAPIILTFLAVVAVVAALRAAWESDFLGIRTALTEFWEGTAKPALAQLMAWLKVNIPAAIETLRKFWEQKLLPAMETVWAFIRDSVIPMLVNVATTAKEIVGEAIIKLTEIWETILFPILEMVWGFIQDSVVPLFETLAEVAELVLGLALRVLARIWKEVLWPALEKVWKFIKEKIIPIFKRAADTVTDKLGPPLQWLADTILPAIEKFFKLIAEAVEWVISQLKALIKWLKKVADAWDDSGMAGQSASPFETAVRGIADAVADLARVELPALEATLGVVGTTAGATAGAGGGEGGGTTYSFSMTVQPGEFDAGDVIMGYEQMRALVGA